MEAVHKFDPEAANSASNSASVNGQDNNLLALEVGDRLVVLDKFSEAHGWWKACDLAHRTGYIPKSYVKPVPFD